VWGRRARAQAPRARVQVTTHQLLKEKEAAAAAAAAAAAEQELIKKREVSAASYGALVAGANPNREEGVVEARSVEAAISALSTGADAPEDRNPEKCASLPAADMCCICCAHLKVAGASWRAASSKCGPCRPRGRRRAPRARAGHTPRP